MRKVFLPGVVAMAMMMTPAFAAYSVNKSEAFGNGSNGWLKSDSNGNKLAVSQKSAANEQNQMWTYFVAPSENYASNLGRLSDSTLEKDLSAGRDGGSENKDTWQDVTHSSAVVFVGGALYWSADGSNDSSHNHSIRAANFNIDDNTSVAPIRSVPAPGAILLSSLGAGLVGWLRSRRVL